MPSKSMGAVTFGELADQYAAEGNTHLEALCRYQRARCIKPATGSSHAEMIDLSKERAVEYERAAQLFDSVGDAKSAGRCWYLSAYEYNILSLVIPKYAETSYAACKEAAIHFEDCGDWWGKGLAETVAGQTVRQEVGHPPDPRRLRLFQSAAESFKLADRPLETSAALMTVAVEQARSANDDEWMASAVRALHAYEEARPGLQLPHERDQWDTTTIRNGVRPLTSKVRQAADRIRDHPRWNELIWLLIEAPKARSFQDQRLQNEAWSGLVSSDAQLAAIVSEKEQAEREKANIEHQIGAGLAAGMPDFTTAMEDTFRNAEERVTKAHAEFERRIAKISRNNPERASIASIPPVSMQELQRVLHNNEAYISYRWNGGAPLRVTVTPESYAAEVTEVSVSFVKNSTADAVAGNVPSHATPSDTAAVVGDIPDGVDTLIISPDSLLLGLPWNDLPMPSEESPCARIGERFRVAVAPAAGFLRQLRSEGAAARDTTYVGVACRGIPEKPLGYVDWEVKAVKDHYFADDARSIALTTEECPSFLANGCKARVLHFASHAQRHGLLLSQDNTWTTPVDFLKGRGRTFGADIILLTGCYAGDFSKEDSNEFLGILRQLMVVTGARAAVTSIAKVMDPAGPLFADMLLAALTGSRPKRLWNTPQYPLEIGQAVAWARQTMRKLDPPPGALEDIIPGKRFPTPFHPCWWAPWFVVGDPSVKLDL